MIEAGPETLSPPLVEMREAFSRWEERGFQNAWESLNAVAEARVKKLQAPIVPPKPWHPPGPTGPLDYNEYHGGEHERDVPLSKDEFDAHIERLRDEGHTV